MPQKTLGERGRRAKRQGKAPPGQGRSGEKVLREARAAAYEKRAGGPFKRNRLHGG